MNQSTANTNYFDVKLNLLANRCALAVMAIGLLGICGWLSGIEALTRITPHFQSIKFNTALSFLLAGAALKCREHAPIRITIGILISILGALTLSEYVLEDDFGIDQFFISDKGNESIFPGRMSPATAVCILLSGLTLGSIGHPSMFWRQVREILALTIGVFGFLTILGYLLSEKLLYQLPGFGSVALPTGFAFLILSLGMLSIIEESLLTVLLKTWRSYRKIWLGFCLLMFLLAVTGIAAVTGSNSLGNVPHAEITKLLLFGLLVIGLILDLIITKKIILTVKQNETALLAKQRELQQSRMDLDRAQEVGQIGWWRLDTTENILTWSDENHRIFNVPKGTPLSYNTFLNLVHPADREFVDNQWVAALRGEPYDIEHRIIVEGQVKWVREKAYVEFDKSGLLLGGFGITQDITKRKQVEFDLLNAQESLGIAVEAAQMGTWDLDLTRDFSGHRNLRHDQIFGYETPQPEWGLEIARFHVIEEDRGIFDAALTEARETGILNFEVRILWPDGSIHWMAARGRFYFDERGKPVRGAGVNYDITERKQAEEALQDADRRKNEFLAMLGHELRNPLTPLAYVAQTLSMPNLDALTLRRANEVLQRNIQHITQLVDDLLDVSRMTRGLIKIQKQRVELNRLLKESVEPIQESIKAKQQTFHLNLPPDSIVLDGDPVRLTQIFTNLLTNAVKYTGVGGHIELSARVENPTIYIIIKDNGIGIEADLLPKIFDLFTQSERSLDRPEGGLGIGLTLVKKLVELHGGEITVQSQGLNHGAEFSVRLPNKIDAVIPEKPDYPPQEVNETIKTLRFVLIDDNPDVAHSLATWLELSGHQVKITANGAEGILATENFNPDIVILDIGLPDMNGYEVARKLRELPGGKNLYLICLSGYAPNPDKSGQNEHGFDHYLIKPPQINQLRQLIADYQQTRQTLENC